MSPDTRVLVESLLRSVRSVRHAMHAAELALLKWMEVNHCLPEKDDSTGDRKVR